MPAGVILFLVVGFVLFELVGKPIVEWLSDRSSEKLPTDRSPREILVEKLIPNKIQDEWRRNASAWLESEPTLPSDKERVIFRIHEESGIKLTESDLTQFLAGKSLSDISTAQQRRIHAIGFFREYGFVLLIAFAIPLFFGGIYWAVINAEQKQIDASRAAAVKREQEVAPIRNEAKIKLEALRRAREHGKTTENIRVTATREENAIRLTVYNESQYPLKSVIVAITDSGRRKKFWAERYNGVRMDHAGFLRGAHQAVDDRLRTVRHRKHPAVRWLRRCDPNGCVRPGITRPCVARFLNPAWKWPFRIRSGQITTSK